MDLGITTDHETMLNDCLFELSETDPNEVASMLAEDGHLLESLQEKLIDLHDDMKTINSHAHSDKVPSSLHEKEK